MDMTDVKAAVAQFDRPAMLEADPAAVAPQKGVGLIALLWGAALLAGALAGSRDPLHPLEGIAANAGESPGAVGFERIRSVAELDARLASAGRVVMLDFYADWCVACKEYEKFTFTDAKVRSKMSEFVLLKADVTANNAQDKALLKRFNLFGPPGIVFFDGRGQEKADARVIGYQPAEQFLGSLKAAAL